MERGKAGSLEYLRERGRAMVEKHLGGKEKEAKPLGQQRLLLFRHDYKSPNMLQVPALPPTPIPPLH